MKMFLKKNIFVLSVILLVVFSFASCVSSTGINSVLGVWKAETTDDYSHVLTLTENGKYAYENYYKDELEYAEFGDYENDENGIIIDDSYYDYSVLNKILHIEHFKGYEDITFKRTSRIARSSVSSSKLKGVWNFSSGIVGFTGSFMIYMGRGGSYGNYKIEEGNILVDFSEIPFLIINNKLYLDDSDYFLNSGEVCILEKQTEAGMDNTSYDILVNNNPWHLIDTGDGNYHYIYNFDSNGKYNMNYYSDTNDDSGNVSGTFEFSSHTVKLSDSSDLAYAVIDMTPFMFTI